MQKRLCSRCMHLFRRPKSYHNLGYAVRSRNVYQWPPVYGSTVSSPCLETVDRTRRWAVYKLCFGPLIAVTLVEVVVGFDGRFCSCIWLMRPVPNKHSPPGTVHLHGHPPCWLVQVDMQPQHMNVVLRCGYLTANHRDKTLPLPSKQYGGGPRTCLLYTSPSPRDLSTSRMPSSA